MYTYSFPGGSDGKESACNAGDLGLIPGLGSFPRRRAWQPTPVFLPGKYLDFQGFSGSSASRESACNLGDSGLIPGSERSPGEQMGYPLQYS